MGVGGGQASVIEPVAALTPPPATTNPWFYTPQHPTNGITTAPAAPQTRTELTAIGQEPDRWIQANRVLKHEVRDGIGV